MSKTPHILLDAVFQSLIGRLRTVDKRVVTPIVVEFQSLIGRLRTWNTTMRSGT